MTVHQRMIFDETIRENTYCTKALLVHGQALSRYHCRIRVEHTSVRIVPIRQIFRVEALANSFQKHPQSLQARA